MAKSKTDKREVTRIQQAIDKAIRMHDLLEEGDKITVGLSGGADSLVLLDTLAIRRKYFDVNYSLQAIHVNITNIPYSVDREYLENFCASRDVEFIWHDEEITIDKNKVRSNLCFICSWNRRRILFQLAEKTGANKLALGHHKDDALETMLMNMIFHGSISSLPFRLKMFDGALTLIRPLLFLEKKDVELYAKIKNIEARVKTCPYATKTHRTKVWSVLEEMQKLNPKAKDKLFDSMSNIYQEYLPVKNKQNDNN